MKQKRTKKLFKCEVAISMAGIRIFTDRVTVPATNADDARGAAMEKVATGFSAMLKNGAEANVIRVIGA